MRKAAINAITTLLLMAIGAVIGLVISPFALMGVVFVLLPISIHWGATEIQQAYVFLAIGLAALGALGGLLAALTDNEP